MREGYLPPVVCGVEASAADLIKVLADAKALLAQFSATPTTRRITGDAKPLDTALASARATADAASAEPVTFTVRLDGIAAAMAQMETFRTYASVSTGMAVARWNAAKTAAAATVVQAAAAEAAVGGMVAGAAGGGRRGGGGLLAKLLWGGGAGGIGFLGLGAGMAGFGSLGAFAGLGPEHLLMTLLGLAGSAGGGALGAGALGLGSLGKIGVGGGSDLLVSRSTLTGVKAQQAGLLAGQNASAELKALAALRAGTLTLAQATTLYGQAAAQAQQNVASLSATVQLQWFKASSAARVQSAALMTQVVHLGQDYVPLVADAATRNLRIINTSLQPLFGWLEGPQGMGIFKDLENEFASELPTAVHAFDQGVELLLQTMDYASHFTGGFVQNLDRTLTRLNTPSGFERVKHTVDVLISDFRLWGDLLKNLGRDIYDLFSHDAGTAQSIVLWLDQMLIRLGNWERSAQGGAAIHSVFEVHKQEILALLALIPPLVEGLGKVYLTVAPPLTKALTTVLQAVVPLLDAMVKVPFGAWVLGLVLITGKLGLLSLALGPVVAKVGLLAANWAKIGWNAIVGAAFGDSWLGRKLTIGPASAGPDTVFAGAVNEFSAAVTRFAATSVGGAVGGVAGGGATAGEAEAAATGAAAATGLRSAFAVAGSVASKAFFAAAVVSLTDQVAQVVTGGRAASLMNADSYGNLGHAITGDTGLTALQNLFTEATHVGTTLGFGHTDMDAATRKLQDAITGPNFNQGVLDAIRSGNADELGKLAEKLRQYGFGKQIVDEYHKIAQTVADDARNARGKLNVPAQVIADALYDIQTNIIDQVSHLAHSEMADMLDMEHRIALIKAATALTERQTTGALGAALNLGGRVTFVTAAGKGSTVYGEGGVRMPGQSGFGFFEGREKEWIVAQHNAPRQMWAALDAMATGRPPQPPIYPVLMGGGVSAAATRPGASAAGTSDPALVAALQDVARRLASIDQRLASIDRSNASIDRSNDQQVALQQRIAEPSRGNAAYRLRPT